MNSIFKRKSVRKYQDKQLVDEQIKTLLKAAMAAPSAGNQQPWEFIVVKNRDTMDKLIELSPYSNMLKEAPVAIIVCGDESKERFKGYWVQDCSAATQNILIQAEDMGLGAVWLGVYPVKDRVEGIKQIFNLPESVIPLSIVSVGYPDENKEATNRYSEDRIHNEIW